MVAFYLLGLFLKVIQIVFDEYELGVILQILLFHEVICNFLKFEDDEDVVDLDFDGG